MRKAQARAVFMAGSGIGSWSDSLTKMLHFARFEEWWKHYRGKTK